MSENLKNIPGGETNPVSISWHAMDAPEVLSALNVPAEVGLTTEEAERRLAQYGPNELQEKKRTTFLQMLWAQINSFVIWLLIGAAVISALLGDYVEAGDSVIVILNAIWASSRNRAPSNLWPPSKAGSPPNPGAARRAPRLAACPQLVPGDIVFSKPAITSRPISVFWKLST